MAALGAGGSGLDTLVVTALDLGLEAVTAVESWRITLLCDALGDEHAAPPLELVPDADGLFALQQRFVLDASRGSALERKL